MTDGTRCNTQPGAGGGTNQPGAESSTNQTDGEGGVRGTAHRPNCSVEEEDEEKEAKKQARKNITSIKFLM